MEDITQEIRRDIVTNRVNLLRATVKETAELRNLLDEQIVLGYSKIIVDLSQCTQLDSTFIGALVVTQKTLLAKGGDLKLVDPLEPAKELFHLIGIYKIINTFETSEDALNSYNEITPPEPKSDDVIPKKNITLSFA